MKLKTITLSFLLCSLPAIATHADVEKNWNKNCKKCHGDTGAGDTNIGEKLEIKDYTDAASLAEFSDEDLFVMTKDGVPDTKMRGYEKKLSDEEIQGLVEYMRSFSE